MAFETGQTVRWNGQSAKVLGNVPGFGNLRRIELASGESKEVNVASLTRDVSADPRNRLPTDVREVLMQCERVLNGPNGMTLVSILRGATRGPDYIGAGADAVKQATTAKLRKKAWGTAAGMFGYVADGMVTATDIASARSLSLHFSNNIRQAAEVFGEGR